MEKILLVSEFQQLVHRATAIGYRRCVLDNGKVAYRGEYGGVVVDSMNYDGTVAIRASTSAHFALGIY